LRGHFFVAVFVSGCSIKAQVASVDLLAKPMNGTTLCRSIVDPEGVLLEFTDAGKSFGKRETTLGFDNEGNPVQMAVTVEAKSAEGKTVRPLLPPTTD